MLKSNFGLWQRQTQFNSLKSDSRPKTSPTVLHMITAADLVHFFCELNIKSIRRNLTIWVLQKCKNLKSLPKVWWFDEPLYVIGNCSAGLVLLSLLGRNLVPCAFLIFVPLRHILHARGWLKPMLTKFFLASTIKWPIGQSYTCHNKAALQIRIYPLCCHIRFWYLFFIASVVVTVKIYFELRWQECCLTKFIQVNMVKLAVYIESGE